MEQLQRRIYRRELRSLLGWSDSWYREQIKRGVIPRGHTDPGGKREWFTGAEAQQIIDRLTKAAVDRAQAAA